MNLKNLLNFCVMLFALIVLTGTTSTQGATWYVDAQYGLDGYTGTAAIPAAFSVGPKQTIQNALNAASDGDVIVIAPRGLGSIYNLEPAYNNADGLGAIPTVNVLKTITFQILADPTTGFAGSPNTGNAIIGARILINDATGVPATPYEGVTFTNGTAYKYEIQDANNLTLTRGSVTGAANLRFAGTSTVARLLNTNTLDATPDYATGYNISLSYGPDASAIIVGPEWASDVTKILNVTNLQAAAALNITSSLTMNGALTNNAGGGINIASNTLTINAIATTVHGNTSNIVSTSVTQGEVKFTGGPTGGANTITWNGVGTLPSVHIATTYSGVTPSSAALTAVNAPTINGSLTVDAGSDVATFSALTLVTNNITNNAGRLLTVTLAVVVGNGGTFAVTSTNAGGITFGASLADGTGNISVVNSGSANIAVTTNLDIENDVQLSGSGNITVGGNVVDARNIEILAAGSGLITVTGTTDITGSVTNSANIAYAATAAVGGKAIITLTGNIVGIDLNVTNQPVISAAPSGGATGTAAYGIASVGKIVFGGSVIVNGNVVNNPSVSLNSSAKTNATLFSFTDFGNITFANAGVTIDGNLDNGDGTRSITSVDRTGEANDFIQSSGSIYFANVATNVIIKGRILNRSVHSQTAGDAVSFILNGDISFLSRTAGTITVGLVPTPTSVTNSSIGTVTNNGRIMLSNIAAGLVTVNGDVMADGTGYGVTQLTSTTDNLAVTGSLQLNPTGTSQRKIRTAGTGTVNITGPVSHGTGGAKESDIDFTSTGAYTLSSSLTNSASTANTAGDYVAIVFAAAPVTVTLNTTNTSNGQIFFGATTQTVTLNGDVSNQGAGQIYFAANTGNVIAKSLTNNGGGSIAAPFMVGDGAGVLPVSFAVVNDVNVSSGVLAIGNPVTGAATNVFNDVITIGGNLIIGGGTVTIGAVAGPAVPIYFTIGGNLNLSSGQLIIEGANTNGAVNITGGLNHTGGLMALGTNARGINVAGSSSSFTTAASYTNGAATTLTYISALAQSVTVIGGGTRTWPGFLIINNTLPAGVGAWTLSGGNYMIAKDVTFTAGQVVINGVYLFITGNFNYNTTTANEYFVTNPIGLANGFVSMKSEAGAASVVNGTTGNKFGNFEVDHLTGVNFTTGKTYSFTGFLNLTRGIVAGSAANATLDFNNTPVFPTIVRNDGSLGANLLYTYTTPINVLFINSTNKVMGAEIPAIAGNLNNLTINPVGAATKVTTLVDFTVMGQISIASGKDLEFDAAGRTITMGNGLAVGVGITTPSKIIMNGDAQILCAGVGEGNFVLNQPVGTSIEGTGLTGTDPNSNTINANIAVLNGSIGNALGGTLTSTGVRNILGDLSVNGTGTISLLFVNESPVVDNYDNIDGNVTTAAGTTGGISLLSNVHVFGNYVHQGGVIALGSFDFEFEGLANSQTGPDPLATLTGTGYLRFENLTNVPTVFAVTAGNVRIPQLDVATTVGQAFNINGSIGGLELIVTNYMKHTSGNIVLNVNDPNLRVTGNNYFVVNKANATITGAVGTLILNPTTGTLAFTVDGLVAGTYDVDNVTFNGDVTLTGTNLNGIDVNRLMTHTAGLITFGSLNITIDGANGRYTRAAGTYDGTGVFIWNSAAGLPNQFINGPNLAIPQFQVNTALTLTTASPFTVKNSLYLNNALFTHGGQLIYGDTPGQTMQLRVTDAGALSAAPNSAVELVDLTVDGLTADRTISDAAGFYWTTAIPMQNVYLQTLGFNYTVVNSRVMTGDLNLQGHSHLVVSDGGVGAITLTLNKPTVAIYLNNGGATATVSTIAEGANDLLVVPGTANLFYNAGAGSPAPAVTYATGPEYARPVTVNNITLGTNVTLTIGQARTIAGVITGGAQVDVNAATTINGSANVVAILNVNAPLTVTGNLTCTTVNVAVAPATLTVGTPGNGNSFIVSTGATFGGIVTVNGTADWTFADINADAFINGNLIVRASAVNTSIADGTRVNVTGNVDLYDDIDGAVTPWIVANTGLLAFTAAAGNQNLNLYSNHFVPNLSVNQGGVLPRSTVTMIHAGGAGTVSTLTVNGTVFFTNGIIVTGVNILRMTQTQDVNFAIQGFDRTGVEANVLNEGYVYGNVQKLVSNVQTIARSSMLFPVGAAPATVTANSDKYRQLVTNFVNVPASSFYLTVKPTDNAAAGSNGWPLGTIARKAPFGWTMTASQNLPSNFTYELELWAEDYTDFASEDVNAVKIVGRNSNLESNPWSVQGANYSNYLNGGAPTYPVVKVLDATGNSLITQGSEVTMGLATNLAIVTTPAVTDPVTLTVGNTKTIALSTTGGSAPMGGFTFVGTPAATLGASIQGAVGAQNLVFTPTAAGTGSVTIRVVDGLNDAKQLVINLSVSGPLTFTQTAVTKTLTVGQADPTFASNATGGAAPIVYSLVSNSNPAIAGVTVVPATGAYTLVGPFTVGQTIAVIHAVDNNGAAAPTDMTVTINVNAAPTVANHSFAVTQNGTTQNHTLEAPTGGTAPFTYAVTAYTAGNFVASIAAGTNVLTVATPFVVTPAPVPVTITLTDVNGVQTTFTESITVNAPLAATNPAVQQVYIGTPITLPLTNTGGTAPFDYSAQPVSGTPASLTAVNAAPVTSVLLTGLVQSAAPITITKNITDASGATAQFSFTAQVWNALAVANVIPPTSIVTGNSAVIDLTLVFTGGRSPFVYSVITNTDVTKATTSVVGANLTVNGIAAGTTTLTVQYADANGTTITTPFTVTVTDPTYTLSGNVTYDNVANSPLPGVVVSITNGFVTLTGTTDVTGNYSIPNVHAGTYAVTATSAAAFPLTAISPSDATKIIRHYVGLEVFTDPVKLLAGDVNNSATVNSTDAFQVVLRSNGNITSFAKGDWVFSSLPAVVVAGNSTGNNLKGLAVGDVNASYVPAGSSLAKASATVSLMNNSVLKVSHNKDFELPVRVSSDVQLGSYKARFTYPNDLVTIQGISSAVSDFVLNDKDGVVSVSWFDATGKTTLNLKSNDVLFKIKFKPTDKFVKNSKFNLELDITSEMGDVEGNVYKNITLNSSNVEASVPDVFALKQNYPNPFNPSTTIEYDLPTNGTVTLTIYNVLGQQVSQLVNEPQQAGTYKYVWNASNLSSGMYIFRVDVRGENNNHFTDTRRMMLLK